MESTSSGVSKMNTFGIAIFVMPALSLLTLISCVVCFRVCRAYRTLKKEADYLQGVVDDYFGNKEMLQ